MILEKCSKCSETIRVNEEADIPFIHFHENKKHDYAITICIKCFKNIEKLTYANSKYLERVSENAEL